MRAEIIRKKMQKTVLKQGVQIIWDNDRGNTDEIAKINCS